jgi:hypothetical protein
MFTRTCFVFMALLAAANTYGLVLDNPSAYVMETYAQYAVPDSGVPKYAEFDAGGNLYVTHSSGLLVKINSAGQSEILGHFQNLQGIYYAGGTLYGDVLYFNDADAGKTLARQTNGTVSTFATYVGKPIGITTDKSGLYGGQMFVPARYSSGSLYKISETGQVELFLQLGAGWSGHDIESDGSGVYGGLLYMSVTDASDNSSIWAVRPDKAATLFCNTNFILDLEFDTTSAGAFGGLLYGRRSSWAIGSISPEGQWTRFASSNDIKCLAFGPDNSMYVVEEIPGNLITVIKISAVPEPATILLLGLGGLFIRFRIEK